MKFKIVLCKSRGGFYDVYNPFCSEKAAIKFYDKFLNTGIYSKPLGEMFYISDGRYYYEIRKAE